MYVRFIELPVYNQGRAVAFYTEKLGLHVAQDSPYQEGWRWITLELAGSPTKILFTLKTDANTRDDVPNLVLTVDDVYEISKDLKEKGVVFTTEPTVSPWDDNEVYAIFRDSEDNLVMIGTESN